jgi:tetratricopeptide (TPR) repeat protein
VSAPEDFEVSLRTVYRARDRRPAKPCLDEERIVSFYSGRLNEAESEAVREHLAECPACLTLARESREFLAAMAESSPQRRRPLAPRLLLAAASIAVAVGAGVLWMRGVRQETPPTAGQPKSPATGDFTARLSGNPWQGLPVAKAPWTHEADPGEIVWRSGEPEAPAEKARSSFDRAMRLYEQDDFAGAQQRLTSFLEKNPQHAEAHFYLGVSLLMLGRSQEAIAPLETAAGRVKSRAAEEAHWYLALAHLKNGEFSAALEQLDAVIRLSGRHSSEAQRLRREVEVFARQ